MLPVTRRQLLAIAAPARQAAPRDLDFARLIPEAFPPGETRSFLLPIPLHEEAAT